MYTEQGQTTKPVTKTQKCSLQTDFQERLKTSLFVRKLSPTTRRHFEMVSNRIMREKKQRRSNITGANQRCMNQHFTFFYFISQSAASVAKTPPQQRPLHIRHVTMDAGRPENGWFYKCKRKPLEEPGHQFGPAELLRKFCLRKPKRLFPCWAPAFSLFRAPLLGPVLPSRLLWSI